MLSINTNLSSVITQSSLKTSTLKLNEAIERMTTGSKLNHAKDNAANYSICTNMSTKISAYQVAEDNALMGLDMVQTASDSLSQLSDLASRLRALAVQAGNGIYGSKSIASINQEAASIIDEINRIRNTAEYNGKKLFKSNSASPEKAPMFTKNEDGFIRNITKRDTSTMTSIADLDENAEITSGTYSISTAEELAKLATMTNNGKLGAGVEFVLDADIDLSGVDWTSIGTESKKFIGKFDGNGYVISNINNGLFKYAESCSIKNVGLKDAKISTSEPLAGILGGDVKLSTVENCYATGSIYSDEGNVAGLIGWFGHYSEMTDCYTESDVIAYGCVGGLVGGTNNAVYTNCYSSGNVSYLAPTPVNGGGRFVGGLIGAFASGELNNCGSNARVHSDISDVAASAIASGWDYMGDITVNLNNCVYDSSVNPGMAPCASCGMYGYECTINMTNLGDIAGAEKAEDTVLQVGVSSDTCSQILFNTTIAMGVPEMMDLSDFQSLGQIDSFLKEISCKQTELGAIENRLESVLEEVSVQYENLVSSRSTLQDTDIAEVSSEYIRQQILQQASATLMATANQTPAVALQLL